MSKIYYISIYPTPGTFYHYIVQAEDHIKAIHKLNYQARHSRLALLEKDPKDIYHKAYCLLEVIKRTRRYKRHHTSRNRVQPFCDVHELPLGVVWYGQLNLLVGGYAWNILPKLPLTGDHQEIPAEDR